MQLATTRGKRLEDQEMTAWLPEKAQCIFCWIFVTCLILKEMRLNTAVAFS